LSPVERDTAKEFAITVGDMNMARRMVANPPFKNVTATPDFTHTQGDLVVLGVLHKQFHAIARAMLVHQTSCNSASVAENSPLAVFTANLTPHALTNNAEKSFTILFQARPAPHARSVVLKRRLPPEDFVDDTTETMDNLTHRRVRISLEDFSTSTHSMLLPCPPGSVP
jgi:hypothetical protein